MINKRNAEVLAIHTDPAAAALPKKGRRVAKQKPQAWIESAALTLP